MGKNNVISREGMCGMRGRLSLPYLTVKTKRRDMTGWFSQLFLTWQGQNNGIKLACWMTFAILLCLSLCYMPLSALSFLLYLRASSMNSTTKRKRHGSRAQLALLPQSLHCMALWTTYPSLRLSLSRKTGFRHEKVKTCCVTSSRHSTLSLSRLFACRHLCLLCMLLSMLQLCAFWLAHVFLLYLRYCNEHVSIHACIAVQHFLSSCHYSN